MSNVVIPTSSIVKIILGIGYIIALLVRGDKRDKGNKDKREKIARRKWAIIFSSGKVAGKSEKPLFILRKHGIVEGILW